ncbi:alpha/beta fold hydrolase [Vibrio sonorensis]|uniref:alpha/beta fold hydrolase n=1 Tax=Vibrio sonorensis TaxID=1004316 RepID=UPI0008D98FA7|nr:alpha/beta fold hydrolase [Vibrio sonorensis]
MNASSDTVAPSYTQEADFEQVINTKISLFWQEREQGYIKSKDKKQLFWVKMTAKHHTRAIFVVNGRIESCWKYQELFYDLFQQGYDIYSFDHRGQGLSERLIEDKEMGYVDEFDDYVNDMAQMVEHFQLERYQDSYLLAHSMGGTIATRYLQTRSSTPFSAISLSAPMFGVSMPWYFRPVALPLSQIMSALYSQPTYAPGYQAYYPKPFEINPLSQSKARYSWFRDLYEQMPELKIGGPSTHWVWQGLMAAKQCIQLSRQIKIPLLLLQASNEAIVSNEAQSRFIKKLAKTNPNCAMKVISGSKHEVLFEKDVYRNSAIQSTLDFFCQHHK